MLIELMMNVIKNQKIVVHHVRGRSRILQRGSWLMAMVYIVRSTMSMRSMLMLGGSGGMLPQENLKN